MLFHYREYPCRSRALQLVRTYRHSGHMLLAFHLDSCTGCNRLYAIFRPRTGRVVTVQRLARQYSHNDAALSVDR